MPQVLFENISEIKLNVIPIERRFDSEGDLSIDEKVRETYIEKKYDSMPKTEEEADARGLKVFNGLMSSFPRIAYYSDGKSNIVAADIAPTRYLIGQAMRDIIKQDELSEEEIRRMSPNMANVSIIVPVRYKGQYYLVSQIKGKALGSGEILAALVAGNVDGKYLFQNPKNPLIEALKNECSEEIGMDLSYLNSTSFICGLDDGAAGINFVSVAKEANLDEILNSYAALTKQKIAKNEELELMALSMLKVSGLALTPLEKNNRFEAQNVLCFYPNVNGLRETVENRVVRPYTESIAHYLSNQRNVHFILDKAGF